MRFLGLAIGLGSASLFVDHALADTPDDLAPASPTDPSARPMQVQAPVPHDRGVTIRRRTAPETTTARRLSDSPLALGDPQSGAHGTFARAPVGEIDEGEHRPRLAAIRPAWPTPRIELGYGYYRLATGYGTGAVHSAYVGGFLPFGSFRAEATGEFGIRAYDLGDGDIVFRGALLAGYQHLKGWGPLVPYAGAVGTLGVVFGTRFRTSLSDTLVGGGLEVGSDLRIVRKFMIGCGFSYLRLGLGNTSHNVFLTRVRIGL